MATITWRWVALDEDNAEIGQLDEETFMSQSEAETWLGENWRTLASDGAATVRLIHGKKRVYDMSLES